MKKGAAPIEPAPLLLDSNYAKPSIISAISICIIVASLMVISPSPSTSAAAVCLSVKSLSSASFI